ncbi:hypothetical protein ACJJTC_002385 [Scirpophaga incertulas]
MSDKLKDMRERSQKRKKLLAQTLGVSSVSELRNALGASVDIPVKKPVVAESTHDGNEKVAAKEQDSLVYTDSSTFLKGTQSSNPHNDYCQHFVDTGQRPQNFIRDVGLADRFEEYPKLRELIKLKDDLISETATPPMYLKCDLKTFDLKQIGNKFDVILVEPPLGSGWRWPDILALELQQIAQPRSFVFLWCGSSEGLDMGKGMFKEMGVSPLRRHLLDKNEHKESWSFKKPGT